MRTIALLSGSIAGNTTSNGGVFYPKCLQNEDLVVQFQITGTATGSIQGRATPEAPWVNIRLNQAGETTVGASGYRLIPAFPEMRAVGVTTTGSSATVNVWLAD